MEQPPELPLAAEKTSNPVAAPHWARFLAAGADLIVAGLLAFAIITVILIPTFYPTTLPLIQEYANKAAGNIFSDSDLAETMIDNPALRQMLVASQVVLYAVFFLYFLLNEKMLNGGSLGKMIFRIRTANIRSDQPLTLGVIFARAWLKTVLILFFSPFLWITFLWAFFQEDRRTVHDLLTGTWVVD